MKKRTLALMLSAALCVGMLAGCGGGDAGSANSPAGNTNSPAATESETPDNTTELTGTVVTNGSTSMESVMGSLTEAFREVQPGIQVQYTGSGSGAGITSAQDGTADIGLASRDLKDDETGVKAITVAKDGIAIIINPENPVADLSVEQIAQLATGEITNWSEVGGNDAQVVFIGREAGSGTRDGFESITGTEDACKYQNELTSTGEVIANVASNPNAIGYASLSAVDDTVKAITVGGVAPTEETVLDGTYAIQRNFNFIVSDSAEPPARCPWPSKSIRRSDCPLGHEGAISMISTFYERPVINHETKAPTVGSDHEPAVLPVRFHRGRLRPVHQHLPDHLRPARH